MSDEEEPEPLVISVTPQVLLGNTRPAKMPIKHLKQAQVKKLASVSGYIQRSTVIIDRNGDTYLVVGKRVNYESSKTFQLFIHGDEAKGYTLWIPEMFRGKWDPVYIAAIDEDDMDLVPVTNIIIGDPPEELAPKKIVAKPIYWLRYNQGPWEEASVEQWRESGVNQHYFDSPGARIYKHKKSEKEIVEGTITSDGNPPD